MDGLLKSNQADVILDEMEVDFMKRVGMEKNLLSSSLGRVSMAIVFIIFIVV